MAHKLVLMTSSVFGKGKRTFKTARQGEERPIKKRKTLARRLLSVLVVLAMLMPTMLSAAPVVLVRAADTDWQSPSDDIAGAGDGFESNPDYAYVGDGIYAENQDGPDDSHLYFDFDLVFPIDVVVTGIEVRLDGGVDSTANSPQYEVDLSWDGGNTWSSARSANLYGTIVPTYSVVGGQTDLWGRTAWPIDDFSNANFRVRITSRATGVGSANRDFYLDWVAVRVTYASAHIAGTIWSDDDANGVRDGGEAGLESIHVTIYQDDGDSVFEGGSDDLEVGSGDTGVDGTYDTGPFLDGYSYWVDVDAPVYYTLTTPPEPRRVLLPDTNSVSVDFGYAPPNSGIAIAKTPDDQMVASGSTANFTIVVTNTGDVELTGVTVSDALVPDCNASLGTLPVGDHTSYGCTLTNVTDGFINSAIATGTPSVGPDVTDTDAAKVRLDDTLTCPADMLAYWNLDEPSGSTYDDFYNGHDGECAGDCPTPTTAGHINGGQLFNGSGTGIDIPDVPGDYSFDWGVDDSFSIEFWMQTDIASTCSGNEVVIGRANGTAWWVGCEDGGTAAFYLRDTDGHTILLGGITDLTDGTWHYVVAVRDANTDQMFLYVDGTEEDSEFTAFSSGFAIPMTAVNIGWFNRAHGYHFDGVIDEVAIYSRALSEDDVRQHHSKGLAERWYCETGAFAPTIVSSPVTDAIVGHPYVYDVEAAGDPAPTYTLMITPTGMTIDPLTGVISWTPTMAQEGNHNVQVQASNPGGTDTQSFIIVVQEGTLCPTNMIAYWKLDETSGTSYHDFYDGHNGACASTQGCPTPVTGHIGGAQEFSSTTGIDIPSDAAFNWGVDDSFSIELWMRTDSASSCYAGNQVIIGRDTVWWVGCHEDANQAAFWVRDASSTATGLVSGTTDITDGAWHHIVAVRDAAADEIRIYVDTVEFSESVEFLDGFSSTDEVNIGWLNVSSEFHFDGAVDEVAIYNRALLGGEIQQHYNEGEPGPGYCINPEISVNKVANPSVIYSLDTVVYSYLVTNPGDDPLSSISLSDDNCDPTNFIAGDEDSDGKLDPDESWIYTCEMNPAVDITNIASITGTYSLGGIVTATDTAFVDVITPGIAIDKVADPTIIYPGETVTYTYTVTNPGNDPLDVDLSDDKCSPLSSLGGDDNINGELDPGEIWTYRCTAIISIDTPNTVTITGTDSAGGTVVATDTAFVDVINPAIEIAKTPDNQMVRYGSTSTFTVAITNTSDAMLTNITVFDALASDCDRTNLTDLAPTESTSYTCTQDNVMADFTNTAIVTGTPPVGPDVSDTDTAFVHVISPSIEIAKTPDNQTARYNSTATFTIAVTNTGDVILTNVVVLDVQASDCITNLGSLAPTESASYTCGVTVTADFTNTATVVGTPPVGPNVSDADTAFVDLIGPGIVISKSPDTQMLRSGSTATFTIVVTNTGDATLTNVTVSDALVPDCDRDSLPDLAPTESTSYTCTVTNVMTDFTNRATVTGTPPIGLDVSHADTAFVDVISPSIAIAKTPVTQTVRSDSMVTFTIAVTNTGDVILTNVTVSDVLVPDCDRDSLPDLAPTGSTSYTCTVTNVIANFTNIATVIGTPPVGPDVSGSASAFVRVEGVYKIYLPLVLRG